MVTTMPAGEKGAIAAGEGIRGATTIVMAPASTMRMRGGTNVALKAGATRKQEVIRMNGHSSCASHASSCPVVSVIMSASSPWQPALVDQRRNAFEQLTGVADQHLEHP